jgi:transcriptional regulator with AAA-type ATPase domain
VDFRIIAATNRDLEPLVAAGAFGADLLERLAIVRIHLPLRERLEDLPALVDHMLDRFARDQKQPRIAAVQRRPVGLLGESGGNATKAAQLLGTVGRGAARDPGGTVRAMKRRLRYRG